jgi:hypothetical protein
MIHLGGITDDGWSRHRNAWEGHQSNVGVVTYEVVTPQRGTKGEHGLRGRMSGSGVMLLMELLVGGVGRG